MRVSEGAPHLKSLRGDRRDLNLLESCSTNADLCPDGALDNPYAGCAPAIAQLELRAGGACPSQMVGVSQYTCARAAVHRESMGLSRIDVRTSGQHEPVCVRGPGSERMTGLKGTGRTPLQQYGQRWSDALAQAVTSYASQVRPPRGGRRASEEGDGACYEQMSGSCTTSHPEQTWHRS